MKTSLQLVMPEMARQWLKKNVENRRLRPNVVRDLLIAWERRRVPDERRA